MVFAFHILTGEAFLECKQNGVHIRYEGYNTEKLQMFTYHLSTARNAKCIKRIDYKEMTEHYHQGMCRCVFIDGAHLFIRDYNDHIVVDYALGCQYGQESFTWMW